MTEEKIKDWANFRRRLLRYAALDRKRREQLIFRGQSDSTWGLRATLDRGMAFKDDDARDLYFRSLVTAFRREVLSLGPSPGETKPGDWFELLARHHGLPSPFLDWTESPFIASFFAFQEAMPAGSRSVALWVLDTAILDAGETLGIDLIKDPELIRFNSRALRQRAVFLRVSTTRSPVEGLLQKALTKYVLPSTSRDLALAELDEMGINAVGLFGDHDAAAKTALYRVASANTTF